LKRGYAHRRGAAFEVHSFLEGDRNPVQAPKRLPSPSFLIGSIGFRQRLLGEDLRDCVDPAVHGIEPLEARRNRLSA
jgi:hypothetical protein